jgi:ArsR family transcriptional regulator
LSRALDTTTAVAALKAAAEPTRLRILMLLARGEHNVSDLTRILGQSQPRVSRHLKLMAEAGLIDRFREGSWVYFHLPDRAGPPALAREFVTSIADDEPLIERDRRRADEIRAEREAAAQAFFAEHAADWDRIRSLHVAEAEVEAAVRDAVGPGPFSLFVDLGTGTGRMLELFADRYARGLGFDVNHDMLAYARSRLDRGGLTHAQVRHGDLYALGLDEGAADVVVMHQVLHFLSEPARAIREAARILAPGGRLVVVDFAPHDLDFLRERYRHERLGFAAGLVPQWMQEAGLVPGVLRELPQRESEGQRLTVTVWTGEQPARPVRRGRTGPRTADLSGTTPT